MTGAKAKKCTSVSFGKLATLRNYLTDNTPLTVDPVVRDLGMQRDSSLAFNQYTSTLVRKSLYVNQIISNSMASRSKEVIIPLYSALIRPIIICITLLWYVLKHAHAAPTNSTEDSHKRNTGYKEQVLCRLPESPISILVSYKMLRGNLYLA